MRSCIVPGCTSGYRSNPGKFHFFCVPKDLTREWEIACKLEDVGLKEGQRVCNKHFRPGDIVWAKVFQDQSGKIIQEVPLKRPYLKAGVIPSIFPWTETIDDVVLPEVLDSGNAPRFTEEDVSGSMEMCTEIETTANIEGNAADPGTLSFETLKNSDELILPLSWRKWIFPLRQSEKLFLSEMVCKIENEKETVVSHKEISVYSDLTFSVSVTGNPVNMGMCGFEDKKLTSVKYLQDILIFVDEAVICKGCKIESDSVTTSVAVRESSNTLRHERCPLIVQNTAACKFCHNLPKVLHRKKVRLEKRCRSDDLADPTARLLFKGVRRERNDAVRKAKRLEAALKLAKKQRDEYADQIKAISASTLEDILEKSGIEPVQCTLIREIFSSSQRSSKGKRYDDDWLVHCLLLHMRSPQTYRHLRDQKILPLPSTSTVRRHLSKIDGKCGFDENYLEVLKQSLENVDDIGKHGVLIWDEMATREMVSLDTKNLSYRGLTDFGGEVAHGADLQMRANHGLVFMYQPINSSHRALPIRTFLNHGSTTGEVLAKLIIKAIICLENAGLKIHGLVSDGAQTNRNVWTRLGGDCGKETLKNFIEHPLDENRRVFLFSDPPHLMKTIRNRMEAHNLKMEAGGPDISWSHIQRLYEKD